MCEKGKESARKGKRMRMKDVCGKESKHSSEGTLSEHVPEQITHARTHAHPDYAQCSAEMSGRSFGVEKV